MLKKFFVLAMLTFSLILTSGISQHAEASPVFVGYYQDNGDAAYLLTETIAGGRNDFTCTVRTNRGEYIYYHFYSARGGPYYTNSWGASAYVYGGNSPVAENIWGYMH